MELLSLKEFMAQWFNILIQKIETVEKQNGMVNQMRESERESSSNSLQSSSSSSSVDDKLNSASFHHSCSEKSTRPPSSSSGSVDSVRSSPIKVLYRTCRTEQHGQSVDCRADVSGLSLQRRRPRLHPSRSIVVIRAFFVDGTQQRAEERLVGG